MTSAYFYAGVPVAATKSLALVASAAASKRVEAAPVRDVPIAEEYPSAEAMARVTAEVAASCKATRFTPIDDIFTKLGI